MKLRVRRSGATWLVDHGDGTAIVTVALSWATAWAYACDEAVYEGPISLEATA